MEQALEDFLAAIAKGEVRRDLFIFPNRMARELFRLELIESAQERGMYPMVRTGDNTVTFHGNESTAMLRVAHPFLDRELQAYEFHAAYGLDHLGGFERGADIRSGVLARARL
jgi:hypothetical protein